LLLGDLLALGVSLGGAYGLTSWLATGGSVEFGWLLMLTGLIMPATFALFGLYPGTGLKARAELGQVALATTLLFAVFLILAITNGVGTPTMLTFIVAAIGLQATVPLFRNVTRWLASSFDWWGQPALIFGGGEAARHLYNYYSSHPRLGIRPVAIIDDWSVRSPEYGATKASLFSDHVESIRREHNVYWAIISTPLTASSASTVRSYLATFPYVLIVPEGEGLPNLHRQMFDCGNLPCVPMTNTLLLPLPRLIKSVMDFVLIIIFGMLCLPLVAMIVLLIKLTSPGPVFYAQERVGKESRRFWAWKFRTMVVNADEVLQKYLDEDPALRAEWELDHKLKNDPRVSTIGVFLRKTSLDELPQLWNVLRGEMSLVGPRPIVTAEIEKYGDWFELYEQATPGITGMWQISGRNNTTYDVRVAHDRFYVLNWSPWLDLYILARTIKVVLCREGAY
jgi:Undecaprenyl-phosphate galactose phosphotransferase WbaP